MSSVGGSMASEAASAGTESTPPRGQRRRVTGAAVAVAALVAGAAVWWAWPTFTHDSRPGVLVVADDFIAGGERSFELRAREDGRTVRWVAFDPAWCDDPSLVAAMVERVDPERVVVSAQRCVLTISGALRSRHPLVVQRPEAETAGALATIGAVVVDPERLVGQPGDDPRRPCEWWERCDLDGRIAVREPSGELTTDGQERVARMVVAAL